MISFVVALFNHINVSRKMLDSLRATATGLLEYEVVLIDDCSSDGTSEWLSSLNDERIIVLRNEENLGYAKSVNRAATLARGDILVLLNNDLILRPGWLESMLDVIDDTSCNAGIVGNLQYRVSDGALDHAGVEMTSEGKFVHIRHEWVGCAVAMPVVAVTGACILIRKADFDTVGGYDERYVNGCEDLDLAFRLRSIGKQTYVATKSRILHHVSLSRGDVSERDERNSCLLFASWRKEIKAELVRVWTDMLRKGDETYWAYLEGTLLPGFLSTPNMAALAIAEGKLRREEARWSRMLDGKVQVPRVRALWSGRRAANGDLILDAEGVVLVAGVDSLRNFFVCGYRLGVESNLALTITVNGIQEKYIDLGRLKNFNAGILDPIVFPARKNRFLLSLQTAYSGEALCITHFVVDDQVVDWRAW